MRKKVFNVFSIAIPTIGQSYHSHSKFQVAQRAASKIHSTDVQ